MLMTLAPVIERDNLSNYQRPIGELVATLKEIRAGMLAEGRIV